MTTLIGWTDETWNPVTGCTKVSPGCDHCYAERITNRFGGPGAFDTVVLHPDRLFMPLHWKRPRMVFVNSMSDLFHHDVPDDFTLKVFDVMAEAKRHTYQVLTKRPGRMASLLGRAGFTDRLGDFALKRHLSERHATWTNYGDPSRAALHTYLHVGLSALPESVERAAANDHALEDFAPEPWPLPNVWLGTSVEDQKWADVRVPKLLKTPAAVHFLSCEPLLGPVDLHTAMGPLGLESHPGLAASFVHAGCDIRSHGLDWVIVGGESGPERREMDVAWLASIVEQCDAAGVPVFVKQDSGARSEMQGRIPDELWKRKEYPA